MIWRTLAAGLLLALGASITAGAAVMDSRPAGIAWGVVGCVCLVFVPALIVDAVHRR